MIKADKKIYETFDIKNNDDLKVELFKAKKDKDFKEFVENIDLSDDYLMKYTNILKECFEENKNCSSCKGLDFCNNEVKGCKKVPFIVDGNLNFSHKTCRYKNELLNMISKDNYIFSVPKMIKNAKMKDIYTDDKNRVELIKWMTSFIKKYKNHDDVKGLYLSGSFGSGKSYLISAMINELVKDGYKAALVYYPEFLRSLKASFGKDFDEQFEYAKNADILLLDDIGAENITAWSRDEILGPILQYRMEEKLPTFFTSNLSIQELEIHLSSVGGKIDKLKAKRLIERINFMCDDIKLISKNNRK